MGLGVENNQLLVQLDVGSHKYDKMLSQDLTLDFQYITFLFNKIL